MSILNFATKELTLKIVYYGPGLGGKTTNLQVLHGLLTADTRGKLLSLATEKDRTLFFDLLPVSLGKIKGFAVKIQLYTVPGQVYYNKTRKLVLKGADAVVFVANSQKSMRQENVESLQNMWDNLRENNLDPDEIPTVLQ
ncbi:MAG TPA: GTPase domain-containing protein [Thermodesulfovibrionia bacterium]|nr:GTPase domain-containing protein [Thermodesulfovibrionia bacterium]